MKRELGKLDQRDAARTCVRQDVQDRLLGVILVRQSVFIVMVRSALNMHLRVTHLKCAFVVEHNHLPRYRERLAEDREKEDDCEQSAHEIAQGCN